MRGIQRVGHFNAQGHDRSNIERLPVDHLVQRLTVEQFHHEKRMALCLADVVDRTDMGMIEGRCRACFALEALPRRVGREGLWQHLDRDVAIQPRVARAIHLAHPAGPGGRR